VPEAFCPGERGRPATVAGKAVWHIPAGNPKPPGHYLVFRLVIASLISLFRTGFAICKRHTNPPPRNPSFLVGARRTAINPRSENSPAVPQKQPPPEQERTGNHGTLSPAIQCPLLLFSGRRAQPMVSPGRADTAWSLMRLGEDILLGIDREVGHFGEGRLATSFAANDVI